MHHQVLYSYTSDSQYKDTDRLRCARTVGDPHQEPRTCTLRSGSTRCTPAIPSTQCNSLWLSQECAAVSSAQLSHRPVTSANVCQRCRTSSSIPLFFVLTI